jgi:hypothetical protein
MPTKTFYLDDSRAEPLTASWGLFFRNFTVSYSGVSLEPTNPAATIAEGRQYRLPDGRIFSARHKQNTYPQELELLIDGQPVPGSGTHPHERIKQAWYVLLVLGILNIGLGLVAEFGHVDVLLQLGVGWGSLVEGVAYIALGYFGYFRTSVPALTTALVLLVLDAVLSVGSAISTGHSPALGGLLMRAFFCMAVFRAMQAARQLRRETAVPAADAQFS